MKNERQCEFRSGQDSAAEAAGLHAMGGAGGAVAAGRGRAHARLAADGLAIIAAHVLLFAGAWLAGGTPPATDPAALLLAALLPALLGTVGLYRRNLADVEEARVLTLTVGGLLLGDAALRLLSGLPPVPAWQIAAWPVSAAAALMARTVMRGPAAIRAPRPATRPDGRQGRLARQAGLAAKRLLDITLSAFLLVLLCPAFLGLAILICRDGGPLMFAQTRVGRGGKRFACLKFRTMHPDAEARLAGLLAGDPRARAEWARHQKLREDPRVTPVGRFLRATSLDELPQLINVLRGEMSLVGPRPIVAPEVPGYPADHAYFHGPAFRLYAACRPGITGLWQVMGRAATTHDERIRLDAWYARNWSFWLDIVILLRTVPVVLRRSGW